MKNNLGTKLALGVAILLIVVVFIAVLSLFSSGQRIQPALPTPTQSPIRTPSFAPESTNEIDKDLVPTQAPEYIQKITREPFWNALPYWAPNKHFRVDYKDSSDQILITTFETTQQLQLQYRQEARTWLEQNGAKLETLTIRYQTETYPE